MNTIEPLLKVHGVGKEVETPQGPLTILRDVSFQVMPGEKVAIIGPSGSGKSTLLSLIGLLDTPSLGDIAINGVNTNGLTDMETAKLRNTLIGFIFQSFELIQPFTVYENITAPLEIGKRDIQENQIAKLMEQVGLTHRSDALPRTLSGGEKQRVAIARALAHDPALLLADEPTGSLDRTTGERVLTLLLDAVREASKTLIIITHDEHIAEKMDRVFVIENGSLYERR